MVRWSETTRKYVGPPEHSIQWSCGPPKYLALDYRLLVVRLTMLLVAHVFCRFLSQFSTDFYEILKGSPTKNCAIFIQKHYIVQKLDHLTCSKFVITMPFYKHVKPIKLVGLKFKNCIRPTCQMVQLLNYRIFFYGDNLTVFGG